MNTLARIARAREALEDGDVGLVYDVLIDLEHDLAGALELPSRRHVCPCGAAFRWPGELDHHQRFAHFAEAA